MIGEAFIEELKRYCDIQQVISGYVALKRGGRSIKGICPFHSEKTPSFTVFPENQSFYCFGCGTGGDVINFVRKAENLDYVEAVKFLAEKAGLAVPDDNLETSNSQIKMKILEINRETAKFYYSVLISSSGEVGRKYLHERGLTDNIIKKFGIGYATDSWDILFKHLLSKGYKYPELEASAVISKGKNGSYYDQFHGRVIFPIIDLRKNVIGFGGRIIKDERGPKYLNSPDTLVFKKSRNLYSMNIAKSTKANVIILAEGYMDVISIAQAGFDNVVATLGTSLTEDQARLMSQYTNQVVIAYDSDAAGVAATKRAVTIFDRLGIRPRILSINGAKDPDEFIKKYGAARFKILINNAENALEFELDKLQRKYDVNITEDKVNLLRDFVGIIAPIEDVIERDVYITKISLELGVDKDAIVQQVKSARRKIYKSKEKREQHVKIEDRAPGLKVDVQRVQNRKYAMAEDKLITILLKNPDYCSYINDRIKIEDFVTDVNKTIFQILIKRLENKESIEMIMLSAYLTEEQMSNITGLVANNPQQTFTKQDADTYINIILSRWDMKTKEEISQMTDDDMRNYMASLLAKSK